MRCQAGGLAMSVRFHIAVVLSIMVNSVIFGIGTIMVLTTPKLSEDASFWIPVVVVLSLVLSPPISWFLAPRLRNRYWQKRRASP